MKKITGVMNPVGKGGNCMQCGCPECGILMAQVDKGWESYCQCPACLHKCRDCLGRDNGFSTFVPQEEKDKAQLLERIRKYHNI